MIWTFRRPVGARSGDERPLLQRQELGAQEAGDLRPVENADDEDDAPEIGAEDRHHDSARKKRGITWKISVMRIRTSSTQPP